MMTVYATMESPVGELVLAGPEVRAARDGIALTQVSMRGWPNAPTVHPDRKHLGPAAFAEATTYGALARQLKGYAGGVRRKQQLLALEGAALPLLV